MKKKFLIIYLLSAFLLVFTACDKNDDSPTEPEAPATVGVYSGNNSMDTTMTVTVSNIGGTAYVTSYSINYKITSGSSGSIRGNYAETNSEGLSVVTNNSFEVQLGTEANEVLVGTINGSTISGSFTFPSSSFTAAIAGTYTITKN